MSEDEEKVKLRRFEPAIQKFIKIVIPTDLERLRKHQINIEKVSFSVFYHKKTVTFSDLYLLYILADFRILESLLKHLVPLDLATLLIFSVLKINLDFFFSKGCIRKRSAFFFFFSC